MKDALKKMLDISFCMGAMFPLGNYLEDRPMTPEIAEFMHAKLSEIKEFLVAEYAKCLSFGDSK